MKRFRYIWRHRTPVSDGDTRERHERLGTLIRHGAIILTIPAIRI
jgi:hypothetical protein